MIYKDALYPVTYITLLVGEIFVKGIVATTHSINQSPP